MKTITDLFNIIFKGLGIVIMAIVLVFIVMLFKSCADVYGDEKYQKIEKSSYSNRIDE